LLRGTAAGDSKLKAVQKRLRAAERRCVLAEQASQLQQCTIEELNKALTSSQDQLSRQASEIRLLSREQKPSIENCHIEPIHDSISFSDCQCVSQLPDELCHELNEIMGNSSLQNSSKFRSVLSLLCSFYAQKLGKLEGRQNCSIERADQIVSIFGDFLTSCGSLLLNQTVSIEEFLANPKIKSRLLAGLRTACYSQGTLEEQVAILEAANNHLAIKVHKLKRRFRHQNCSAELLRCSARLQTQREQINELEAATRRLAAEKSGLQETIQTQKREFLAELQAAKADSIVDYEKIITQLKRRCDEQRETIQNLSQQLAATASART
jgi:uncharacterized coiled-coil protein SlyX